MAHNNIRHTVADIQNDRLANRWVPSHPMPVCLPIQSVDTRYVLPGVIPTPAPAPPLRPTPLFNQRTSYAPGASRGPADAYFQSIELESKLMGRTFVPRGGDGASLFTPRKSSNMFSPAPSQIKPKQTFQPDNHLDGLPPETGSLLFNNSTRTQMRN